jgi:DNA-binding NarL/FixJ family response regulator
MEQHKLTILLVDDSVLVAGKIKDILQELQVTKQVMHADSYDKAVEIISSIKPHIAILDIHLPGKSGIDLLAYIKARFNDIKVVMLSNQADLTYRDTCKKWAQIFSSIRLPNLTCCLA